MPNLLDWFVRRFEVSRGHQTHAPTPLGSSNAYVHLLVRSQTRDYADNDTPAQRLDLLDCGSDPFRGPLLGSRDPVSLRLHHSRAATSSDAVDPQHLIAVTMA